MNREEFERLIMEGEKNAPSMFHPVHERNGGTWFPSNEAGSIASIISHTWEDIHCLFRIRKNSKTDYERKLLFKYIIIELHSMLEQIEKLQGIIFSLAKGGASRNMPNGYISKTEAEEIKVLFKKYYTIKKEVGKEIFKIRNKIGAHRGNQPWINIMELWDKLAPDTFKPLLNVIPELFDAIKKLDIYDWTRSHEDGSIEICCSGLNRY